MDKEFFDQTMTEIKENLEEVRLMLKDLQSTLDRSNKRLEKSPQEKNNPKC